MWVLRHSNNEDGYRVFAKMGTGWRNPIVPLKLQVIFRKRATNYKALLQKMTYEDKTCYGSWPPCIECDTPIVKRLTIPIFNFKI